MKILNTALFLLACNFGWAQQVADSNFTFKNENPRYANGKGTRVWIDEAHYNFHTSTGRYAPFAKVVREDGYTVEANTKEFTVKNLENCGILVVANALHKKNATSGWIVPTPSFVSKAEIKALKKWVNEGGSLFLIADHMPFAGAAYELGKAFGFEFVNGFALDAKQRNMEYFTIQNGGLIENEISRGNGKNEKVDTIVTFTGSAFKISDGAVPLVYLGENYSVLMPDTAWQFNKNTDTLSANGLFQGAYKKVGKGKIVVFGEAGMFSAQIGMGQKFGMNLPESKENPQLLLNIIHWLDPFEK
ncbi:MAG TPA: DUF4350 domain-containing protein [Flavobacteriales bacterium]|nr:DUF4350 domain-containing protein [Flavobacteriales bacterium]